MKLLPLFLASASLAAANQQPHVVTVTNYLPFDQHRCREYFMLGGDGNLPAEACQPGACCIGVEGIGRQTDGGGVVGPETSVPSGTDGHPITTAPPTPSVVASKSISGGSIVTKVTSSGSVTRTFIETISNNRTITEEITATSVETVPETSREAEIITTTVPEVETFTTTTGGTPVVETTTSEVLTTLTTSVPKVVTFTTTSDGTPTVETTTSEVLTTVTTTVPEVETFTTTTGGTPVVETTTTEVLTTITTTTNVVVSTTETFTTPVVVTSTELITSGSSTITSVVTTTSEETLTSTVALSTTTTEIITSESVIVTPTLTTITVTTTVDPLDSALIPPPPDPTEEREIPSSCPTPTCAHGIEYALYDNPFSGDLSSTYASFSPEYFKHTAPVYNATLHSAIYISDDNTGNGFNPLFKNAAAGYRAYLFACQAGRYRFNSPYSDDITIMWFGDKAHDGYTRDNADIIQFYYGDNRARNIYRDLEAGTYYPIRVLWGNTGGAADLSLRIFGPDGQDLSGADQAGEYYVTTEACDGSYGEWPPWGEEK